MRPELAPVHPDAVIAAFAAKQHGVVALLQLLQAGLSRQQVKRRLRSGRLHRLYRGVYAVGHPIVSREGTWMAAVLACGDGAALSHRDAAAIWGVRGKSARVIDVTVPKRSGRARRDGLRIHRAVLPPEEVTLRDGIPVTSLARTLLDLAGVVPFEASKRAIEQAERLRIFDVKEVEATLERRPGRRGAVALKRVLGKYEEPPFTRSDLEDLLFELSDRLGLPRPAVNATVAGYEVDFVWPPQKLIVETDGREDHLTRHAFEQDRVRDARLTLLGYRVIRFTYRQLHYERTYVKRVLLQALQAEPSISSTR